MAVYIPKFNGFIADVANIDFKRCDGTVYSCQTATATNMTPTANSVEVTGGQGQYPIGFIDTGRSLVAGFTNAMFDADMFEIANSGTAVDGDSSTFETKKCEVITGLKIELPFEVEIPSVSIRGLENSTAEPATGKFKVAVSGATTTITFASGDVAIGDEIFVSYNRRIAAAHELSVSTNSTTAKGSVWMHWPIYSSGDDLNVRSFAA